MRIGILTYHHVVNYGAFLQALAHVNTLTKLFPEAEIEVVDYRHKTIETYEWLHVYKNLLRLKSGSLLGMKRFYGAKSFMRHSLPLTTQKLVSCDVAKAVKFINRQNYDFLIVGSDEVWKVLDRPRSRIFPTIYYLPKEIDAIRIGSAVSANGSDERVLAKSEVRDYISSSIRDFKVIAARDRFTFDLINDIGTGAKLYQVPDPTFAAEFITSGLQRKMRKLGVDFNRLRIAINLGASHPDSILSNSRLKAWAVENDIQLVSVGQSNRYCELDLSGSLNPLEWANCYQFFDFCITDRFHSTVFSLKSGVPFWVLELPKKYSGSHRGKIVDLLGKVGMSENHSWHGDEVDLNAKIFGLINEFKVGDVRKHCELFKSQFHQHLSDSLS
ncbi:MAG TPA: polysaccharide pyruvyl transferase family protein [Pirellulaceae bacterium]|nr:polysaccharide pyruvyl transferase family protein [Pirellulaceae bacterium]HMO93441.1 polysaccharide pyruvyl transferase family protein [Pirellulaceae bacterium]HMP68451.1 polysaccharide pyruvyl transferase family protein [Pirellulaceae bacterium]